MSELALHDPALYDQGFPYERFKALRDSDPVSHHEHPASPRGYWVIARHDDVQRVSRDPDTWRNSPAPFVETPAGSPPEPEMDLLISLDGSAHMQMRKLVNKGFTPPPGRRARGEAPGPRRLHHRRPARAGRRGPRARPRALAPAARDRRHGGRARGGPRAACSAGPRRRSGSTRRSPTTTGRTRWSRCSATPRPCASSARPSRATTS